MSPPALDPVERKIVQLLQEDGRMTTAELARRSGASEPTVRRKLAALQASGALTIRASVEPALMGFGASAYIGVDVDRARITAVADCLAGYPFIDSVSVTTGPYDIMLKGNFETVHALYDFLFGELAGIEGIKDTNSFLVFRSFKHEGRRPGPPAPLPTEDPSPEDPADKD
ncbi:Lrp/AsnC family transcriptional regulator [Frigidibacter sp. MR17.14]|uniref:Lrp/AsnC family transcriptional regulator n=1 Tax=Frigidibacter sp. MR17.14 TaxID=3126509 RepID=UPI003012CEC3